MNVFRRWWFWAGVIVVVGCAAVVLVGQRSQSGAQYRDPALQALAVVALTRDTAQHPLTRDQIRRIVPLLASLKDLAPDEREAAAAVAREVLNTLTPDQRAELQTRRAAFLQRRRGQSRGAQGQQRAPAGAGGQGGSFGGGSGAAANGGTDRLAQRGRMIDRAIAILEQRE